VDLWTTTTPDGSTLHLTTTGSGPGVLVVPGGGVVASDYARLARNLGESCTVHVYDRRGHGPSAPPMTAAYDLDTELDDLRALLAATGARGLLGHSVGGFFALQAALRLPVDAVAVYDPAVAVDGLFPTAFHRAFARAIADGDLPLAVAEMSRGLQAAGAASRLPIPVLKVIARAFLATPIGTRMGTMMPAAARESELALVHGGPATDYAGLAVPALLTCGAQSPPYYGPLCDRLAEVIPDARSIRIPRSSHNAANLARPAFVAPFAEFFGSALAAHPTPERRGDG
jgi:pimeloyl-ACP methyl ester carboxylesterase